MSNMPEDAADFDLMAWLESGTIGRTTVVTYNDVAAGKRLSQIDARLNELDYTDDREAHKDGAAPFPKDEPLSAATDVDEEVEQLLAEAGALLERQAASKMIWHLRAVSAEEIDAAHDKYEVPRPPTDPGPNASQQQREKFGTKALAYGRARTEYDRNVRLEIIATAAEHVETPAGSQEVTVALLKRLRGRPHGQEWLDRLYKAADDATKDDAELPRPTSPGSSTSTRG